MMTPVFTSGKLKGMLEPMEEISQKTIDYLAEVVEKTPEVNMKPIVQGSFPLFSLFSAYVQ